jgi:hypothetical protein
MPKFEVKNMDKNNLLTKILAITGTLLVWFPLLAPFVLLAMGRVQGMLHFDFLIPAELFPIALIGGLTLLWAALRVRSQHKLIGGGLLTAVLMLVGSQGLAAVTGLASGEIGPEAIWWKLVLFMMGVYVLALLAVGVGGILLLRRLFKPGMD